MHPSLNARHGSVHPPQPLSKSRYLFSIVRTNNPRESANVRICVGVGQIRCDMVGGEFHNVRT